MNMSSFFVACCLTLVVLMLGAGTTGVAQGSGNAPTRVASTALVDCGGEPCDAVAPCPTRLARNARTYEITLSLPTQGPAGVIPAGTKVRAEERRALLAYLRTL